MPKLYIISGCNGSGKTTASYTLLPEMWECTYFVNSDEFAKGLSPFDPDKASLSAGRFMVMRIKYLLDRKEDFCIETTLSSRTLTNTIEIARQYGYSITILFFWSHFFIILLFTQLFTCFVNNYDFVIHKA